MNKEKRKKEDIAIDDLAVLIQKGFLELKSEISDIKNELKSEISDTKKELKSDIGKLDKRLGNIEANLNKKVDKVDHNTLSYRIEKLEKKYA